MGLLRTLGVILLTFLTQIRCTQAQGQCNITAITAPDAWSLLVKWTHYNGATNYFLDLRVVNATDIPPVLVTLSPQRTEKLVNGLRPGTQYSVTVKVFQFYYVMCLNTKYARTVPDTSQITSSKAISSTAIRLEWTLVQSAKYYVLSVNSTNVAYNKTFTGLSGVVEGLEPWTTYDCYINTANSAGLGGRSRVRTISTLVQPPVAVWASQTGPHSARVSWQPVERVFMYLLIVADVNAPETPLFAANITGTTHDVGNIMPCSTYQISVSSVNNFLEPGEPRQINYTTNTLSPVTSISVDYDCQSGRATVSWAAVLGADSYRATAVGLNGSVTSCTGRGRQCQLTAVRCGEHYRVHVSAISDNCESTANITTEFQTVPCPPMGLELYRECSSNVIIFSWAPTNRTSFYRAGAVDSLGQRMDCLTTETSCFFTDTTCGRRYQFTVSANFGQCSSGNSLAVQVDTAPCPVQNIRTVTDCQTNDLTSMWEGGQGALYYVVEALGNVNQSSCNTTSHNCTLSGLSCGQALSMLLTSFDGECSSDRVLGEVAQTASCTPQNVVALADCADDSITLSWDLSPGALFYIATATDEAGGVHTCSSFDVLCQITGLRCGATYSAHVISTNLDCNSSASDPVVMETAPCPPNHVVASLDCAANLMLVSWQSAPNVTSFTASVTDQSGGLLSCSTTGDHCRIMYLKCGQVYDVAVTLHNRICPSRSSPAIQRESVPCGPANVHTQVDCGSGDLTVGWNATRGAEGYITTVSMGNGSLRYCNSTQPTCSLTSLMCGTSYIVAVRSFNGTCLSMPSEGLQGAEVPCVPTGVMAEVNCGDSSVAVRWDASRGALSYVAVAVSNSGHRMMCPSNTTSCELMDLHCSQWYNVSVMAAGDTCSSPPSANTALLTVPCAPTNVHSLLDCGTNNATLTWQTTANALTYTGTAVGADGHSVSCSASGAMCQLSGLRCGQAYYFSVAGTDGLCQGPGSPVYQRMTAPCAPQSVRAVQLCGINALNVSWALAAAPLNYTATAWTTNGAEASCSTAGASCAIQGLVCGQSYTVVVMASNGDCTGPASPQQTIQTVPCMPQSVRGDVECASNTLRASWARSAGARSYTSMLSGPGGYSASCLTSDLSCSFMGLMCASTYTLSVVAHDSQCNSTIGPGVSVTTAPCDPQSVTAHLDCGSGVVSVSWNASAGARSYTVLAGVMGQAPSASCHTLSTSCELSQLHCAGEFNVSVVASDDTCNSTMRASARVATAPCIPVIQPPTLECVSNHATVSWTPDPYALGVYIHATSALGHESNCSSDSASCGLEDLLCGQTYTVRGIARGQQCHSAPSSPFDIITAPCTPAAVAHDYTCGTSLALLTWDESLGRESFYAHVASPENSDSCSTPDTFCTFTSLRCGNLYNVSVVALATHCNSSDAAHTQLQTAPCAPSNVSVSLMCANNTALLRWTGSPGAVGYNVSALGRRGGHMDCSTSGTSCRLPNMQCGEMYDITVTPFSESCVGFPSATHPYMAGPCPPSGVEVSLECEGNVGTVQWYSTYHAEMYVATATGPDGHTHTCQSNGTSCSLTDLHCGERYNVTVVTIERGCHSDPSLPVMLESAICPPSNLMGLTDCGTNDIAITWQPSTTAGVTYFLYSQPEGGANSTASGAWPRHNLTGLSCGTRVVLRVASQDSTCTSSYSPPVHVYTAPCPITNLSATTDCGTNMGNLVWNAGAGATSYTATLLGSHGHMTSCTSNTTACSARLDCGHQYTASVVASTSFCNSTTEPSIQLLSAPCLPGNIVAEVDCNTNSLAIQWDGSEEYQGFYTALAIESGGPRLSCNTSSTSCSIAGLRCGRTYGIAVMPASINCGVIDASSHQILSAPCTPERPTVDLNCSSNVATVMWESDGVQQFHMVSAQNLTGGMAVCNSTNTNCTFTQLSCGESYTIHVLGMAGQCTSESSTTLTLNTAPCVPTHVIPNVDCQTSITAVTWDAGRGATSYTVLALGNGHNSTCVSSDSYCAFSSLLCGQDYTVRVMGHDDSCDSMTSQPINVTTAPCPYTDLQVERNCSTNSALVSWTAGSGALMFSAVAEDFGTAQRLQCNTTDSACTLPGLRCGRRYRVNVMGEGRVCPIPARDWVAVEAAPCPPTNLIVRSSCDSDTVTASWELSQGSLSYTAVAEGSGGQQLNCSTIGTSCDISGLLCGQTYQVYVVGVDAGCIGAQSNTHTVRTAPCTPRDVQTHLECQTGVLNVTWQQDGDASRYLATVMSGEGQGSRCDTSERECVVTGLRCGQIYGVEVLGYDSHCNSTHSAMMNITTAPCPPSMVNTTLDCSTNVLSVTWSPGMPGVVYTAFAMSTYHYYTDYASHPEYNCSSMANSCNITGLECGMHYSVMVVPGRDGCLGAQTADHIIMTAPCMPVLKEVEMDCLSDSAWVEWEESMGAELYTAMATDSDGNIYQCNSNEGQCAVANLQCGRDYTFSLIASNQQCSSPSNNSIQSETAPCPPQEVRAWVGCGSGMLNVSWAESYGALSYTATLERTDGNTSCCSSNTTACSFRQLPCAELYVLTVTAEGRTCNSTQSAGAIVKTVPCTPRGLSGSVSCGSNVATMAWNSTQGGQIYIVEAAGTAGHTASCSSYEGSCELSTLLCGQTYTATVVAQDSNCTSAPSLPTNFTTVPCVPRDVLTTVDCENNSMAVSWAQSAGADSYTATITDGDGRSTNCQALGGDTCSIDGLACGKLYHVSVVASDGVCDSQPTGFVDVHSVPCMPWGIKALMDCQTGTALLSWHMSEGAQAYQALAESQSGHTDSCQTNHTSCELEELACGESYTVSVRALGHGCNSYALMDVMLETGPCVPQHVSIQYALSLGQLSWDMSQGATWYSAEAVTEQGSALTCQTNDTSCVLYSMTCSQTYNITVTANSQICRGVATSEPTDLQTEPCPPRNVQARVDCESGAGVVSWEASMGATGYMANLEGFSGDSVYCVTPNTSCSMLGLLCGSVYYVSVVALGPELNSSVSTTFVLHSAPCLPDNSSVQVQVDCENDSALISWALSDGAVSYQLMAMSRNGNIATCGSEESYCNVSGLVCGQTYALSLTAVDDFCQVRSETDVTFDTRPCPPRRVAADLSCGSDVVELSWEHMAEVLSYRACATPRTGGLAEHCNSTDGSCRFQTLSCGEQYEFSVTASSRQCQSAASASVTVQTGPCQTDNLTLQGSCNSTSVVLAWEHARGTLTYVVVATGDLGYTMAYQTNHTSLEEELPCGQSYTFTVTGQDDRCESPPTQAVGFRTAPCIPLHLETYIMCEDTGGAVSWGASDGAESYTAIAVAQDGHTHMCTTNGTHCLWEDLHCGEIYTVHVIANDHLCNSLPSNGTVIHMAPCIPQNLTSSLDCEQSVASLSWSSSSAAQLYVVAAEATSGHRVELTTNGTSAQISEFKCGEEYSLTVSAIGQGCRSDPSHPFMLLTEPCPPTAVTGFMDCISNIGVISWTASVGAEYYTATVLGADGDRASCMSADTHCGTHGLRCGHAHTVSVTAANSQCSSAPSQPASIAPAPCVPVGISMEMDCATNEALVSWNVSQGALSYQAIAESSRGARSSCAANGTQCILGNLTCGATYTVQVVAVGDGCSSLPSERAEFHTVPCTPVISAVTLDCYAESFLVEWAYAEGSLSYTVVARTTSGLLSTCPSNGTNCELSGLACGELYTISVVAEDGRCDSGQAAGVQMESVPCRPQSVVPHLDCSMNSVHVQWDASNGAQRYQVHVVGEEGHVTGCDTTSTGCLVPDLMCSYVYNVTVVAVSDTCNISESDVTLLNSVPCVPRQLEANLDCDSGVVATSWEPSEGVTSYTVVAQGNGGFASSCVSNSTVCEFNNLLCGMTYNISISASDSTCSSAQSDSIQLDTEPCEPQEVRAQMECLSNTGLVSWEEGEGASSYLVMGSGPDGHHVWCNSMTDSCQLPNLHCGQAYNLSIAAQDDHCNSSCVHSSLQSTPCAPTNVRASLMCRSDSIAVNWHQASGAVWYRAVGRSADGRHQDHCNASLTHCDLRQLQCGQTYNVWVLSMDAACGSEESSVTQVQTAPCPPEDVVANVDCDAASMTVTWAANPDAESYLVEAMTSSGYNLSCNSTSTTCSIDALPCGHTYSVTVTATRGDCESQTSAAMQVSSAPCVPQGESGNLDCVTNSVWVSWDAAPGAESYTAQAVGENGHNSNCTTIGTTCNVGNLGCGLLHTFHVIAANADCQSVPSGTFEIRTAPCSLREITVETECSSDSILVSWEMSEGSPLYVATAEDQDQNVILCNSTASSCELQQVACDRQYTIIISASSDKCSSLRSPPYRMDTAPCAPADVAVEPLCESTQTLVSWTPSPVAEMYVVTATGRDGDVHTCSTGNSSCILAKLDCGQPYHITVVAAAGNCTSPPSPRLTHHTVPCMPQNLTVAVQCASNSAALSWDATEGAVEYFGCAATDEGQMLYCASMDTSCSIQGLACGAVYNFSVQASDGVCNGSLAEPLLEGAAPCPPASVLTRTQLIGQLTYLMVSWSAVDCPDVEYLVEMTGRINDDAQSLMEVSSYWTDHTFFEFPLPCSTSYSLTLRARNPGGTSEPSGAVTGYSVPCAPLSVSFSGDNTSAIVSWHASPLATSYTVDQVTSVGTVALCSTAELSCLVSDVTPEEIEVTASNGAGESPASMVNIGPNRLRRDLQAAEVLAGLMERDALSVPMVKVARVMGVSLYLEWGPVSGASYYTLIVREDTTSRPLREVLTVYDEVATVSDLQPATRYCVTLAAKNSNTQSAYSPRMCVTTGVPM